MSWEQPASVAKGTCPWSPTLPTVGLLPGPPGAPDPTFTSHREALNISSTPHSSAITYELPPQFQASTTALSSNLWLFLQLWNHLQTQRYAQETCFVQMLLQGVGEEILTQTSCIAQMALEAADADTGILQKWYYRILVPRS